MLIGCRCALVLTISLLGQSAVQAQTAAPAGQTEEAWHHRGSGITVPATIDGMRRGEQRDLSRGGEFDVTTQFGTSDEPVTVYIYRSAYPNVALWFERTRRAMNENLRSQEIDAAPRSFALAGGAPNGLREEFELPAGGRFRSTAVAMAQTGEWIVKVRITSRSLDRAAIAARMDALLAAMRRPDGRPEPHPLLLPPPCPDSLSLDFRPVRGDREAELAAAAVAGATEFAEARGSGGLAAEPSQWCRATGPLDAFGSTYRHRDGSAWVVLLGDSGIAVTGRSTGSADASGAATFASTPSWTRIAEVYESLPSPEQAVEPAVPVLLGQSPGLAEISATPD